MSASRALGTACLAAGAVACLAAVAAQRNRERDEAARARHALVLRLRKLDHGLRAPLGTVHAALDILRASAEKDGPLRDETMALLDRQVARLRSMVEGLHELACEMEQDEDQDPAPGPPTGP